MKMRHFLGAIVLPLGLFACASPKYPAPAEGSTKTLSSQFTSHAAVDLSWEKYPTETEMGSFVFTTYRNNPVDGTKVEQDLGDVMSVFLWMPSMGHGSSPVTLEHLGVGKYRATNVFFVMKGDWQIHFQVSDGKGAADEAVLSLIF